MFCCPLRSSSARSWASASATRSPLEEEGDVDGRRAAARVSGAGPQARHHRCLRFLAGVAAVSRPRSSATATMQLCFRRSGSILERYGSAKSSRARRVRTACRRRGGPKRSSTSARRETTLQREIAVKNVSLGIFDPARCRRNPDFLGGFPPKPRSMLRNRQGIPRLSGVSSRAHEGETRGPTPAHHARNAALIGVFPAPGG